MITINQAVLIRASPEKVWKVFSNLDLWPKLNPYYRHAKHVSGRRWAKGSRFEFFSDYGFVKNHKSQRFGHSKSSAWFLSMLENIYFRHFRFAANVTILKSNPPYFVEWIGSRPLIKGKHSFTFKKVKNGTEVTNHEEFTGIGLPIMLILNLKPKIEDSFREFMKGLKKEAEK